MSMLVEGFVSRALNRVMGGASLDPGDVAEIAKATNADLWDLFAAANRVRERFRGKRPDLCSIINAKSGACGEDCAFCAQSAHHSTEAAVYPLISVDQMSRAAEHAKRIGARRFCIVTSGRGIDDRKDLENIARGIEKVRERGLSPCATLGTLTRQQLAFLRDAGLDRYHHNIETSREYFTRICSTHTFEERISVVCEARELGLSTCSGGILGMGESMKDRISMAFTLRELDVDSVPINFLMPIKGTPLGEMSPLTPLNALHAIAVFRMILPKKELRVCGGRGSTLGRLYPLIFAAGADGFLIGNYLTTVGLDPAEDIAAVRDLGLEL